MQEISHSETISQSLEQHPQGCGSVSITGDFQGAIRQHAGWSHLGSPSLKGLGQMVFQGPFQTFVIV